MDRCGYTFDSDGNFCVGTTTIETMFKVSVLDYNAPLPEVHAVGPLVTPQNVKVAYILNWIERGLCVDFENKSDEEKLLYFVLEYNKYVKYVNDLEQRSVLKYALSAQKWLILDLHWSGRVDSEHDKHDPAKVNPFSKIQHKNSYVQQQAVYNNETIKAKFGKKKKETQLYDALKHQLESHDYDIFSSTPQEIDEVGNPMMSDMDLILD